MSNVRDTQFASFAKLLMDELIAQGDLLDLNRDYDENMVARYEQVIARRAYDLVEHATRYIAMQMGNNSEIMFIPRQDAADFVSDMTEWPEEADNGK